MFHAADNEPGKTNKKMKGEKKERKERSDNKQWENQLNNLNEKLCSVHMRMPSSIWAFSCVAVQSGKIRRVLDRKQTQAVAKDGMNAGRDRHR